jgi:hypothetical protein
MDAFDAPTGQVNGEGAVAKRYVNPWMIENRTPSRSSASAIRTVATPPSPAAWRRDRAGANPALER